VTKSVILLIVMGKDFNLKKYIKEEMDIDSIKAIYRINDVDSELNSLYRDFSKTLSYNIFMSYFGDNYFTEEDKVNHYNWAFDKTKSSFNGLSLKIRYSEELRDYFFEFLNDIFYSHPLKDNYYCVDNNINRLWDYLFNLDVSKSKSDIDTHIDLYKMFDRSLNY